MASTFNGRNDFAGKKKLPIGTGTVAYHRGSFLVKWSLIFTMSINILKNLHFRFCAIQQKPTCEKLFFLIIIKNSKWTVICFLCICSASFKIRVRKF